GELTMLAENQMSRQTSLMAAAGGIKCSAADLLKWVLTQLNHGKMENGDELFSELQAREMWKPVTTLPLSSSSRLLDKSTHKSYALGWRISDYYGHLQVSHTGTLAGSMSRIILLPDQQLGIVILTNQQSSYARKALARGLLSELVQVNVTDANNENKDKDWVVFYKEQQEEKTKNELATPPQEKKNRTEKHIADNDAQNNFLGVYQDPWFGKITLSRLEDHIIFAAEKSPRIKGKLYAHAKNQWWVKWNDRSHEADAWLFFEILNPGPTSNPFDTEDQVIIKMKAIEDDADWSFDFEDLYFTKLE
ncbi:MAG: serine hydrolase, partial [Kangiellaceae bacterium]|nr:serine hydrolase [Kangiellaceae bacterium]